MVKQKLGMHDLSFGLARLIQWISVISLQTHNGF